MGDEGQPSIAELLHAPPSIDLSAIDTRATPAFDGAKSDAKSLLPDLAARAPGRGAYVCSDPECAASLAQGRTLARSLRAPVTVEPETIDLLHEWQRSASTR